MRRKIYIALASLVLGAGLVFGFATPVAAQAGDAKQAVCDGINVGGGNCNDSGAGLSKVIVLIIRIISVVAGVAAVIMIILGGLKYITSGGDASKVSSAKSSIVYAIIGLVVVAMAQVIVRFVLNNVTK
jgi:hypothetical protein